MPAYEYMGQLPQGTAITGTLEAADIDEARRQLAGLTIHISSLSETPRVRPRRALSREDLLYFNQQLASLADNRIALDDGLRAIARDLRRGPLKRTIEQLAADIESGMTLDQAVEKQAGRFPPLYADVLRAGAETNQLGATLLNLNNHLGLVNSTRRILVETTTYPLIVLTLLVALTSFFMLVVVPHFQSLIYDTINVYNEWEWLPGRTAVPGPTKLIFAASRAWPAILTIAGVTLFVACIGWLVAGMSGGGRRFRGSLLNLIPGFAGAVRASLIARFTNAAALGARAGQPLPALIRSAAGATGDALLSSDAERLAANIEAGATPELNAMSTKVIPSMVTYTIQVAGARGELVEALADLARNYESTARYKMAMVRLLLGPIVLILVAITIGAAAFALMMPMIQLINSLTSF